MQRIKSLEGLRAYLAFWVLICHCLSASGYKGIISNTAPLAVDGFVILSGFVISVLLDSKREPWVQFITRRFFRLWPVYIVLFAVSIPIALLRPSPQTAAEWPNLWLHIAAHIPMLHGAIPDTVLDRASAAFLVPAWSVSLEWQFYLIAPLVFWLLRKPLGPWIVLALVIGIWSIRALIPPALNGSMLPFHAEYFYLGGLLYFAWKRWPIIGARFGFIRCALENRVTLFLGKISYSVYLSHFLIIIVLDWVLKWLPLPGPLHTAALLVTVAGTTIVVSSWLYRNVERPGIEFGKALTGVRLASTRSLPA